MPIAGPTPQACFKEFREHLGTLIAQVLGPSHHVTLLEVDKPNWRGIQLGPKSKDAVGLKGKYSKFYVELRQNVEAVKVDARYVLKTRQYWYKLYQSRPTMTGPEAALRWELAHPETSETWCRHHFQVGKVASKNDKPSALVVPFNGHGLDLNKLHTPTGFVLIEYILRFLIHELGVSPHNPAWESLLHASERKFFEEFSIR